MYMAFRCFAFDLTMQYAFGSTFGSLEQPAFRCPILLGIDDLVVTLWLQNHWTWLQQLIDYFSPWSLSILYPASAELFAKLAVCIYTHAHTLSGRTLNFSDEAHQLRFRISNATSIDS